MCREILLQRLYMYIIYSMGKLDFGVIALYRGCVSFIGVSQIYKFGATRVVPSSLIAVVPQN